MYRCRTETNGPSDRAHQRATPHEGMDLISAQDVDLELFFHMTEAVQADEALLKSDDMVETVENIEERNIGDLSRPTHLPEVFVQQEGEEEEEEQSFLEAGIPEEGTLYDPSARDSNLPRSDLTPLAADSAPASVLEGKTIAIPPQLVAGQDRSSFLSPAGWSKDLCEVQEPQQPAVEHLYGEDDLSTCFPLGDEDNNDKNNNDGNDNKNETVPFRSVSSKKARAQGWPLLSDPPPVIPLPAVFEERTVDNAGRNSGRNWLAYFKGSDGIPRTRYELRILRGRDPTYLQTVQHYPQCNVNLPGGLSLQEICERYPRHVWGTGLRMFIAEGWTGEQIFNALPADFRDSKAAQRPWNYIQQGFTREVKRMNEEDGVAVTPVRKRRRAVSSDNDDDDDDNDINDGDTRRGWPRTKFYSSPRAAAKLEKTPLSGCDNGLSREYDRFGIIQKQENLLWIIGYMKCSTFRDDSSTGQSSRVRLCYKNLCDRSGLDPGKAPISELKALTQQLEDVIANSRR